MKYETDNYELAKQDREEQDKNLVVGKSDLAAYKEFQRKSTGLSGKQEGEDGKEDNAKTGDRPYELDEDMIKEMCQFSNMSKGNNVKKCSANGEIQRVNQKAQGLQSSAATKQVVEDIAIDLDGDVGTNGRPRVREEIKLPPNYKEIDIHDPND